MTTSIIYTQEVTIQISSEIINGYKKGLLEGLIRLSYLLRGTHNIPHILAIHKAITAKVDAEVNEKWDAKPTSELIKPEGEDIHFTPATVINNHGKEFDGFWVDVKNHAGFNGKYAFTYNYTQVLAREIIFEGIAMKIEVGLNE